MTVRAAAPSSADLELAARLVREAGDLAASLRAEGLAAEQKSNVADIVTAADHAAEALIVEILRAERPDDSIVGEEGANHAGSSGRTWVIDPVDRSEEHTSELQSLMRHPYAVLF